MGRWSSTDGGTQCETTYVFGPNGTFELASLDQRAVGFYDFLDDDGGTEINFDFEDSNLQSDCVGEVDSDLLEDGVTFSQYANFPDRNTLILSARPNAGGFRFEFERQ